MTDENGDSGAQDVMDRYADFEVGPVRSDQRRFRFPNGYGASVVWHEFAYGGLEMGILRFDHEGDPGRLTYDTPITDDVLGYLTAESLAEHLAAVKALTPWFGSVQCVCRNGRTRKACSVTKKITISQCRWKDVEVGDIVMDRSAKQPRWLIITAVNKENPDQPEFWFDSSDDSHGLKPPPYNLVDLQEEG